MLANVHALVWVPVSAAGGCALLHSPRLRTHNLQCSRNRVGNLLRVCNRRTHTQLTWPANDTPRACTCELSGELILMKVCSLSSFEPHTMHISQSLWTLPHRYALCKVDRSRPRAASCASRHYMCGAICA